jgi:hypothetical protein
MRLIGLVLSLGLTLAPLVVEAPLSAIYENGSPRQGSFLFILCTPPVVDDDCS